MGLNLDWAPEPELCPECGERPILDGWAKCSVCLSWDLPHPDAYYGPFRVSDYVPDGYGDDQ